MPALRGQQHHALTAMRCSDESDDDSDDDADDDHPDDDDDANS